MISFDDSLWPLLTVSFVGSNSLQDLDAYLATLEGYLHRGERYAVIFDTLRLTTAPSLELRQRQIDWNRKNTPLLRQRSLGTAFVITSPFIRLGLSIMYQVSPPPTPYTVVGELEAARRWVSTCFRSAGLPPPGLGAGKQGQGASWEG
jgi:hypothetical protein